MASTPPTRSRQAATEIGESPAEACNRAPASPPVPQRTPARRRSAVAPGAGRSAREEEEEDKGTPPVVEEKDLVARGAHASSPRHKPAPASSAQHQPGVAQHNTVRTP